MNIKELAAEIRKKQECCMVTSDVGREIRDYTIELIDMIDSGISEQDATYTIQTAVTGEEPEVKEVLKGEYLFMPDKPLTLKEAAAEVVWAFISETASMHTPIDDLKAALEREE